MAPTIVGEVGTPIGLSLLGLGGPPLLATIPTRTMPASATPWIAKVYHNDWSFKASLGAIVGQPSLQASLNGGFQPVTIDVPAPPLTTVCDLGDLVVITEQGGDGQAIVAGTVEKIPDVIDPQPGQTTHQVIVSPFVAELADVVVTLTYSVPTDVAQMIRDAVSQTAHCQFNWETIPNTGVLLPSVGQNPVVFNATPVTDVLNTAVLMAGSTYSWHCDQMGTVWFQPAGSVADYSASRGADYDHRESSREITGRKNRIKVIGAEPAGGSAPVTGLYDNPASQAAVGLRVWDPPPSYPATADSATLQAIANTLGAIFDRTQNKATIVLPRFGQRIQLGQIGAATIRTWEPAQDPLQETDPGSGVFSAPFSVLNVQTDGAQQIVQLGDLPYSTTDNWSYLLERILQRAALAPLIVPRPSLSGHTVMQVGQDVSLGGGRWTIVDGNGQIRVDIGNLPGYTDPAGVYSPPQNGIRILDPSGFLIFDPGGVVGPLVELGANGQGPGQTISATSYSATTPAITFDFTLVRQVQCQFRGGATCHIQAGAGLGYTRIAVYDAVSNALVAATGDAKFNSPNPTLTSNYMDLWTGVGSVAAIGPGKYTCRIETKVDAGGTTMYFDTGVVYGQRLGA
jgi:hypothetical protein